MQKLLCLVPFSPEDRARLEAAAGDACQITWASDFRAEIDGYDLVIGNPSQQKIAACAGRLQWVQLVSSGTDRYDGAFPPSVTLTCATGVFGRSISQHVLAMLLGLYGHFPAYGRLQGRNLWQPDFHGRSLYGSSVLILGAGDIGAGVARLLKVPFACRVTGIKRDPSRIPENFDALYTLEALDSLLPETDVLVCALPATAATRGLLDRRRLGLLKPGATVINVGRGNLLDHEALADALDSGALFGAGLDVTDPEPLPPDHRLWAMDNVIITPHVSGPSFTEQGYMCRAIADLCAENLRRFLAGERLVNLVDIKHGYAAKTPGL